MRKTREVGYTAGPHCRFAASMNQESAARVRTPNEIEVDFATLVRSGVPLETAKLKFEVLWDETNRAAMTLLGSAEGNAYIELLRRMHDRFEVQFRNAPPRKSSKSDSTS
ncbi:protein of unknown function [Pararobbsia alpina]